MPKAPKKAVAKKTLKTASAGLVTTMKQAATALKKRYTEVLRVIDEALSSENLKDRIWAVEQILKRVKPEEETPRASRVKKQTEEIDPAALSDEELMARIEAYLHDAPVN